MGKVVPFRAKPGGHLDAQMGSGGVVVRLGDEACFTSIVISARSARILGENLIRFAAQLEADTKGAG